MTHAPLPHDHVLLDVQGLTRRYRLPRQGLFAPHAEVTALDDVSFSLPRGRHLGIVGESGSGKSTLARLVMALERPDAGRVCFEGRNLHDLAPAALREARAQFQMVFQDPYGSLDPRQRVGRIVAEPIHAHRHLDADARDAAVAEVLQAVGLSSDDRHRHPHEFSGGQRQRIAIARALVTRPRLVVADEPVSALDVSVQAQVLNLMLDLADAYGLTYLFISHDLAVIDHVCTDTAVLYRGRIVEQAASDTLFREPRHPYTAELLAAVPRLETARAGRGVAITAGGPSNATLSPVLMPPHNQTVDANPVTPEAPSATRGCAYAPRCALSRPRCLAEAPALRTWAPGHRVACHAAEEVSSVSHRSR